MARDLPNPQAGQGWSDQSARQWRNLSEEVRRLKGLIERKGLNIPSGVKPASTERGEIRTIDEKTVVITKKPILNDSRLTVREAGYADIPPQPCEGIGVNKECFYRWYGVDFEVYPPLGKEAIDYDGDEWDGATDPKLDTVFHRCHREHDAWVLDLQAEGGSSVEFVRIVDKVGLSNSGQFLYVQRMKKVEPVPPQTLVTWIPDGESEAAECWPGYVVSHYLPMRFQNPEVIVPMTKVGGTQYVWQKNRIFLGQPSSFLPQSDCVVPLVP